MPEQPFDFRIGDLVLYKNKQLIAFNKPATLPVQADKTGDKALKNLGEIYCKSHLHLIHRIDRPASGVVIFAHNPKALAAMNAQFQNRTIRKIYLAVVKDMPAEPEGELVHFLKKNGRINRSFAVEEGTKGAKRAELLYELVGSIDNYHLLKIEIKTGRHHQIRAQLAAINSPIKGDVKYGSRRGNHDRSIHLHAWKLIFKHPTSHEMEEICAPLPDDSVWNAFGFSE